MGILLVSAGLFLPCMYVLHSLMSALDHVDTPRELCSGTFPSILSRILSRWHKSSSGVSYPLVFSASTSRFFSSTLRATSVDPVLEIRDSVIMHLCCHHGIQLVIWVTEISFLIIHPTFSEYLKLLASANIPQYVVNQHVLCRPHFDPIYFGAEVTALISEEIRSNYNRICIHFSDISWKTVHPFNFHSTVAPSAGVKRNMESMATDENKPVDEETSYNDIPHKFHKYRRLKEHHERRIAAASTTDRKSPPAANTPPLASKEVNQQEENSESKRCAGTQTWASILILHIHFGAVN